jgi:hypothetical protein
VRRRLKSEWPEDSEPPDHAILVRGTFDEGLQETVKHLRKQVEAAFADKRPPYGGRYSLSMASFKLPTAQEIATKRGLPNEYFATLSAGEARAVFQTVRMTDRFRSRRGHVSGIFDHEPTDEELQAFIDACGTPVRNITGARRPGP